MTTTNNELFAIGSEILQSVNALKAVVIAEGVVFVH